ncbi:unnamed protein product [Linum tenue]|uniref:Agglutinin domain-containing protein n=1 Tax=Linum tenue TaxID=586396 RepID=A0AAV0IE13_9ROSI|nr:unnamed protein product [Linum tenue]
MHYLWNDEFGAYYKGMGCKRPMDPVSPFVKLEVVPSATDPAHLVHLRCGYSDKFLRLVEMDGVRFVFATADSPAEDADGEESTLFDVVFPADEPGAVGLLHVRTQRHVRTFFNEGYSDEINGVACAYSTDDVGSMERYTFAPWVAYGGEA